MAPLAILVSPSSRAPVDGADTGGRYQARDDPFDSAQGKQLRPPTIGVMEEVVTATRSPTSAHIPPERTWPDDMPGTNGARDGDGAWPR